MATSLNRHAKWRRRCAIGIEMIQLFSQMRDENRNSAARGDRVWEQLFVDRRRVDGSFGEACLHQVPQETRFPGRKTGLSCDAFHLGAELRLRQRGLLG